MNDAAELRRLGDNAARVRDEFERPALAYAVGSGAADAAEALLALGTDPNATDRFGTTALMLAVENPDLRVSELLLQHGADPNVGDSEQRTALFYAARANQAAAIELLLRAGGRLEAQDRRGYTALDAALAVGAEAAAARLRALGAAMYLVRAAPARQSGKFDATHPGEIYRGWQALALAVARNDSGAVRQLLSAGADANMRLPQGDTLLQVAADAHALDCLGLLLAHGADPASADRSGHSVLWLAVTRDDGPVIRALLNAGIHPDTHRLHEETPLFAAVGAGRMDSAQRLLEAGANAGAANEHGRTPLMLAASGERGRSCHFCWRTIPTSPRRTTTDARRSGTRPGPVRLTASGLCWMPELTPRAPMPRASRRCTRPPRTASSACLHGCSPAPRA